MGDLVLYTNPMSRGRIARWMLEEVGEAYDTEIVGYGQEMKSEAYRAINPMGKVPALKHGDTVITEAAAICAYLADAFPDKKLCPPPGHQGRGVYYRWLFFGAGPIEQAISNRALGFEVSADKESTVGYGNYDAVLDTLEAHLDGRDYFVGDQFTAADVYTGSQVMWGIQFGTIDKRLAFEAYAARMAKREGFKRASAIDDALMPQQG